MNKTVSLVLSSGGARGYAHIGAIKELEKNGYVIKSISGSSIGALIGGLYACGKLDEYEKWVLSFDILDVVKLVDFSFSKKGMINGDKVFSKMEQIIGNINIEDLNISFTATATNIKEKKEVWIQKGSLRDAIRASIAIPTIFTPKEINGKLLFDGGILNPIPILPVLSQSNDLVIAINLNDDSPVVEAHKHLLQKEQNQIQNKLNSFIYNNLSQKDDLSYFSIINQSIEAMQDVISRHQLASHRPDIMINISNQICSFYDFHKAKEVINYGRAITKDTLSQYKD